MSMYLTLVMEFIPTFEKFKLVQIPRLENAHANALSKLATNKDSELLTVVPLEHPPRPSTFKGEEVM